MYSLNTRIAVTDGVRQSIFRKSSYLVFIVLPVAAITVIIGPVSHANTVDSRYIAVQYSTILHTVKRLPMWNFCQTLNSRETSISRPNGWAMGFFHELLRKKWPRDIWCRWTVTRRVATGGNFESLFVFQPPLRFSQLRPFASSSS